MLGRGGGGGSGGVNPPDRIQGYPLLDAPADEEDDEGGGGGVEAVFDWAVVVLLVVVGTVGVGGRFTSDLLLLEGRAEGKDDLDVKLTATS